MFPDSFVIPDTICKVSQNFPLSHSGYREYSGLREIVAYVEAAALAVTGTTPASCHVIGIEAPENHLGDVEARDVLPEQGAKHGIVPREDPHDIGPVPDAEFPLSVIVAVLAGVAAVEPVIPPVRDRLAALQTAPHISIVLFVETVAHKNRFLQIWSGETGIARGVAQM